ncbi:MAG TPA: sulfotransferase [Gammaproteobacteria bacterium]|nr:sulfotransferase [Gammaproteobacteria bacterium]
MPASPVFIVGAPRSGTTLLAAMIGSHSRIACGPETQFFNKIPASARRAAVQDPAWPARAVAELGALELSGQRVHKLFALSVDDLRARLADREPGVAAMLDALTGSFAERAHKPRWAEKTPNHLLHLDELRRAYPRAPVIRIVRDPRDAALSMVRLPWTSDSVIANAYLWNDWHERSAAFFARDRNTVTVRFEDLLGHPTARLGALCEFIGEAFEPAMLDTARAGSAVGSPNEPWKRQVSGPLDPSRRHAWKSRLDAATQRALNAVCLPALREFGYEVETDPVRITLPAYPLDRASIEQNEAVIIEAAGAGIRLIPSRAPNRDRPLVALASAGGPELRTLRRCANLGQRVGLLCRRRLLGDSGHYLLPGPGNAAGAMGALHYRLIRALCRPYVAPTDA